MCSEINAEMQGRSSEIDIPAFSCDESTELRQNQKKISQFALQKIGREAPSSFAHPGNRLRQNEFVFWSTSPQEMQLANENIDRNFFIQRCSLFSEFFEPLQLVWFHPDNPKFAGRKLVGKEFYKEVLQIINRSRRGNFWHELDRGYINFNLGNYDECIENYRQFSAQFEIEKALAYKSYIEFSIGFVKGLPQGAYESGTNLFLFLAQFVVNPIHTSMEMYDAFDELWCSFCEGDFDRICKALVPEIYKIFTEWDTLTEEERGEVVGFVIGKYGTDIILPGALVKYKGDWFLSHELKRIQKDIKLAQQTLLLETAADIGNGAKVAEIIKAAEETKFLAKELGMTSKEMGQLKKAGELESTVAKRSKYIFESEELAKSNELYKKAQGALKQYQSKPMPEAKVRALIHAEGIKTHPRPSGIPENFHVMVSDTGAGMKYVDPKNSGNCVRVMPGKPHSPFSHQQKPYVIQKKNGKTFDNHGNMVPKEAPAAHIPVEEFIYRG